MSALLHTATALFGCFLLVAVAAQRLLRTRLTTSKARLLCAAACLAFALVPVYGLPLAAYLRGVVGDFSITTIALLGWVLVEQISGKVVLAPAARAPVLLAIALAGVVLYPAALGALPLDVYRYGYQPLVLLAVLLVLAVGAWRLRQPAAALLVLLAVAAFDFRLLESDNLWDYVLDGWITLYAWGWAAYGLWRRRPARMQR